MLTKTELITQMTYELGDGQNTTADTTVYGRWVDEAVQVIWNNWKWKEKYITSTLDLTQGTRVYAVPTTFSAITSVNEADGTRIPFLDRRDLNERDYDLTEEGDPRLWYWDDQRQVAFYPVPDTDVTYTLYGLLKPDAELASEVELPLPEEFIPALREFLRMRSLEAEELFDGADRAQAKFFQRMREAMELLVAGAEQPDHTPQNINADLGMYAGRGFGYPYLRRPSTITTS